jgi:tripartite-type tricarboxylate transporter receptor subunit TctC
MQMNRRSVSIARAAALALSAALLAGPSPVLAQEVYPSRPIEVIVPWGPGGGSDQTGRKIAKLLENELKVSLPVVNVPGATGNTGILKLIAGRPDGYSIAVLAADTLYANQISGAQKWTLSDLTPIAVMIQQPSGFYVAEGSRFKSWSDVEAEAKSKDLKVAISGFGSPDDVTIGYFNSKGLKLQGVPFANPGERYTSLIGGHTDILYSPLGNIRGMVDSKQMRPIIIFSNKRLPEYKDVPTSKELGYDVTLPQFRAIVVKAGTDPQRVKTIADALARIYSEKEYTEFLKSALASEDSYVPEKDAPAFMQGQFEIVRKVMAATKKN